MTKENTPVSIFKDSEDASIWVAREIISEIRKKQTQEKSFILGLATGSTPTRVYEELIRIHLNENFSFRNVITFNLDEYFPMQKESMQSYHLFMKEHLFNHIDIPDSNIHIPDGTIPKEKIAEYCKSYEDKITECGGLDLQILGIGRTGHIGFNEPGSSESSVTRLVTLDHMTRIDASGDFFGEEGVPRKAITMGIGTILNSKRIIMMAWGEGKAKIIKKAVEGPITDQIPSTFLQKHHNALVVVDEAASSDLTKVKTPWLTDVSCDWNNRTLVRKAVIWLSQTIDKPILKLTQNDYTENGMSDLVTEFSAAYDINIRIFNELQATITGWPGGKPNADDSHRPERAIPFPKKVLIFSPHPDDDVISMGGTLIRLVDQGHEVHVAYQTSGNIAVSDDDAIRFADFDNDYNKSNILNGSNNKIAYQDLVKAIKSKSYGQADITQVRALKGLIRRGEAKAACRYVGIPEDRIHFLNLPFYETGEIKKKPVGQEDIDIIIKIMQSVKPDQMFAAGDLSDPHGTHRVCLTAIYSALEALKNEQWLKNCYLWLYRGAWQEWDIDQIEMAVPLSPDELLRKRKAIFKHQSQKDAALFPGNDKREFWMRAEDRNHATAKLYDKLGLAEYEAIEAFVRHHF